MSRHILITIVLTGAICSLGQSQWPDSDPITIQSDNDDFDQQYDSIILDRIRQGKKVKVTLENARRLIYEQNEPACSFCGHMHIIPVTPQVSTSTSSSTTLAPNTISVAADPAAGSPPYGFSSCSIVPPQQDIPGVTIAASRPQSCLYQLIAVHSPPTDVASYLSYDPTGNVLIGVDPYTGQVYYNAVNVAGAYPCGPGAGYFGGATTLSEPLVHTYEIQCIDVRGVVSNKVQIEVEFPPCGPPTDVCTAAST